LSVWSISTKCVPFGKFAIGEKARRRKRKVLKRKESQTFGAKSCWLGLTQSETYLTYTLKGTAG
jgi:hypothetical protein